jgi:leucyl aminopeptidase
MAKPIYDIEWCHEQAKSVGWECLSKKFVHSQKKLTWKCPEGHIQEITPQYFKAMLSDSNGQCIFCHGMVKRKNSLHWLIQGLSHHGLEKELFKELIQEAQERYDKEIENIEKSCETRIEKLVEKGIEEAKKRFDENNKKYNNSDVELRKIRNNGIWTGIRQGIEHSKYLWNNMEELKMRTNIPNEGVLKEMLTQELYAKILKEEE